jgi:subtilisin family serine protease
VLNQPFLDLNGRGVVVGIVDTGIDYTLPSFRYEDGSSKILDLWDQTVDGPRPDDPCISARPTTGR